MSFHLFPGPSEQARGIARVLRSERMPVKWYAAYYALELLLGRLKYVDVQEFDGFFLWEEVDGRLSVAYAEGAPRAVQSLVSGLFRRAGEAGLKGISARPASPAHQRLYERHGIIIEQ